MRHPRLLVLLLVMGLAFVAACTGTWDPDFFHHLAVGRAVLGGTSFAEDPFVYAMKGLPSAAPPYWLGSVLVYLSTVPFGLPGSVVLVGLLFAATAALMFEDARRDRSDWTALALAAAFVILALPELRVRSAPRPEAIGVLLVAWTLHALRRFEQGRPLALLTFPLVALLWGHVHVSVAFGLGIVGLGVAWEAVTWGLARLRGEPGAARVPRPLWLAGLVVVAAAAASLAGPAGRANLQMALQFLGSLSGAAGGAADAVIASLRGSVEELQRPGPEQWTRPFGLLAAAGLGSFLLHRPRGWGRELATLAVFTWFASTSFRFLAIASVVAAPIAARNLLGWLEGAAGRAPRLARAVSVALPLACLVRAGTAPTLPLQPLSVSLDPAPFPVRAAQYLSSIRFDGRLYNAFAAGGYLEWALGIPVLQDGRGLPTAAAMADLDPEPVDRLRMRRLDARWGFDALVISTELPGGGSPEEAERIVSTWAGAADPSIWSLVALDDGAALYLRRAGRWAGAAARDEFSFLRPGASLPPERLADPSFVAGATRELQRAVREAPGCVQCAISLAGLLLESNRTAEAAPILDPLVRLAGPRHRPTVEVLLSMQDGLRGDAAGAEEHLRRAIAGSDAPEPLRRALAAQLLAQGREADAERLARENLATRRDPADLQLLAMLARRRGDAAAAAALEAEIEAVQREEARRRFEQLDAAGSRQGP